MSIFGHFITIRPLGQVSPTKWPTAGANGFPASRRPLEAKGRERTIPAFPPGRGASGKKASTILTTPYSRHLAVTTHACIPLGEDKLVSNWMKCPYLGISSRFDRWARSVQPSGQRLVQTDFPPVDGRWKQKGREKSIPAQVGRFWQKGEHNFDHALFSPLSRYGACMHSPW